MNDVTQQIFDIYDIWYEPLLTQAWFVIILILLVSIIISLVLYCIYVIFYNNTKIVDPFILIQKKLLDIGSVHIENERDSKEVYFKISEILKQYIAYRYTFSVAGLTDQELLQWAQHHVSDDQLKILEQIFVDMTEIKFEHQFATTKQIKDSIELVQEFIRSTKEA